MLYALFQHVVLRGLLSFFIVSILGIPVLSSEQSVINHNGNGAVEDTLALAFLSSINCKNVSQKVDAFSLLCNEYVHNRYFNTALFIANNYTQKLNDFSDGNSGVGLLSETIAMLPKNASIDSLELYKSKYLYARFGDDSLRIRNFELLKSSSCPQYSEALYYLSQLYYGVELMNTNKVLRAFEEWDYCLNNLEINDFKPLVFYEIGKAIGEKDYGTSLSFLKRALNCSEKEDANNKQFQYECLHEIVQVYVSMAGDENVEQSTDLEAEFYSKKAHLILSDTALNVYEKEAASSVYRIAWESLLWLGKDSLVSEYMKQFELKAGCYSDKELTEGFIKIVNGVEAYVKGEYEQSNTYFNSSIQLIGSNTSSLNYYLELPYAYIGSNYHMLGKYDLAIQYMENSIKTLLSDFYTAVDEEFKFLPVDQIVYSTNAYNVIMCLLRIQYFYQLSLNNEFSEQNLKKAQFLTQYIDDLIEGWFLSTASEKALTQATKLIKRNNAFAIELIYKYGSISNLDKTDEVFLLATEASAFYLNYLKKLKNNKDAHSIEDSLACKINALTQQLKQFEEKKSNDDEVVIKLSLLEAKLKLNASNKLFMQPYISNQEIPNALFNVKDKIAVLKYFLSYGSLYICYYTPTSKGVELVGIKDCEDKIKNLKRSIKSGANKTDIQHLFYQHFIKPIEDNLNGIETLYVLNDEAFAELPFELLLDDQNEPLVKKYSVKYYYSAKNINTTASALNNPSFVGIAPGFINQNTNYSPWRSGLSPLFHSLKEVEQLDSLCQSHSIYSQIYLNKKATIQSFYKSVENADVLHISTHGTGFNNQRKGLYFSEDSVSTGFLSLTDLYGVDVNANLVVLAACKAAVGDVVTGEGIMALPRGFMYAGVPNVLATLWNVDDSKATELMISFYKHLWNEPNDYEKALQKAKLDCIAKGFIPLDWAGFVLLGN